MPLICTQSECRQFYLPPSNLQIICQKRSPPLLTLKWLQTTRTTPMVASGSNVIDAAKSCFSQFWHYLSQNCSSKSKILIRANNFTSIFPWSHIHGCVYISARPAEFCLKSYRSFIFSPPFLKVSFSLMHALKAEGRHKLCLSDLEIECQHMWHLIVGI